MADSQSRNPARLRTTFHIARARLLVDLLTDSERLREKDTLVTTLRVISDELELAIQVLEGHCDVPASPAPLGCGGALVGL